MEMNETRMFSALSIATTIPNSNGAQVSRKALYDIHAVASHQLQRQMQDMHQASWPSCVGQEALRQEHSISAPREYLWYRLAGRELLDFGKPQLQLPLRPQRVWRTSQMNQQPLQTCQEAREVLGKLWTSER